MESSSNLLFPVIVASSLAAVAALVVAQTDRVSRLVLDPARLNTKRREENKYRWKIAMERAHLQLDFCLAGGQKRFNEDDEIVSKITEYLSSEQDMEALINQILEHKESRFRLLKIDRDPCDNRVGEFYLFLREVPLDPRDRPVLYQVPLMAFGIKLAQAFEEQVTTTTLCFLADASSGAATSLVEELLIESKTGVAILSEPLWMVELARLVEAHVFPSAKVEKLLFALCRLDSWFVRDKVVNSRTVVFSLPGQATVSTLLPLVQKVFPEDRHVFAYSSCESSVVRGVAALHAYKRSSIEPSLEGITSSMCGNPIIHATPLPSNSPISKTLPTLHTRLSKISLSRAQVVEAWMSSVDAFFKLKQNEDKTGYLPYVLKLSFLTNPGEENFSANSASYWSLCSLLQFVTGSRSRPLPDGVIDAAVEFLKDYNAQRSGIQHKNLTKEESRLVEDCVFQHKLILIGAKTLQDTVLPSRHWTLKQASKKGGCACCGPDPFDEEDEEEERNYAKGFVLKSNSLGSNIPGAFGTNQRQASGYNTTSKSNYVDGKLGFAFDPKRFS